MQSETAPEAGGAALTMARAQAPVEPPPSPWNFPPIDARSEDEVVGIGADLAPGTLLKAYRSGIFPMPIDHPGTSRPRGPRAKPPTNNIAWWSPNPRGVLRLNELRVTRSLRRSCRRYRVTVNTRFGDVIAACAHPGRDGGWISPEIIEAYTALHHLGWAHSVETWDDAGQLVGGLYGVGIGGLFCGESMFHEATDASKVALVSLVERLKATGAGLLDVQWQTPHLETLGVAEISRSAYLHHVEELRDEPQRAALIPNE